MSSIAWRALKVALRRIHRPTLCTKVCNDLLPTNCILYQWGQQGHDSCPLCPSEETTEHMITCGHPSRLKLRRKYIRLLQTRMDYFGTSAEMQDTLCSTISEWFDTASVDPTNYPNKYTRAIESQNAIGWKHLFMGHFSTEWTTTHGTFKTPSGTVREAYMWEAAIVEVSLKWFLKLWETRNNDVHGHTKTEQTTRLQTRH